MIQFTLNGVEFQGAPLSPERSLDGFAVLMPLIAEVGESVDWEKARAGKELPEQIASALKAALTTFKDLPRFRPLFLPAYKVVIDGRPLPLSQTQVEAQVFQGAPSLLIGWLVAAIFSEYKDFLPSTGSTIVKDLASLLGFQDTSNATGQSGD